MGAEEWAQAVRLLEKSTNLDSAYAQASFELGIAYTRMRNFESAIREWEKMTDDDGDLRLAELDYTRYTPIQKAFLEWEEYARAAAENIFKYYQLGIARLVLGKPAEAMAAFDEVVKSNNNFENVLYYRGKSLERLGRYRDAALEYQRLLEYRPRDPRANYTLGTCLLELGRTAQAINFLQKALTDRPGHLKAHLMLATAFANLMQFDQAVEHLQRALKIKPHLASAHYLLGQCYEKQYRMEEAAQAYEAALTSEPNYKDAHLGLGLLYRNLARHEQALHHLERVTELDPQEPDAYYYTGLALSALKRYQDAIPPLLKAVELSPNNAYAHYTLGNAYLNCSRGPESLECFRHALELNPRDTKSLVAVGLVYVELGELTRAKRAFEKVLEINPNDCNAHYHLGVCKFRLHDYGGALVAYQRAAQVNPNSALRFFSQGAYHSYNRNYTEAIDAFRQATELRPDTEADLEMFANLQLLATVGITHAQTGLELQRFTQRREEFFRQFVLALSNFLDARDRYTQYHSKRVAWIGTMLASKGLLRLAERGLVQEEGALLPLSMVEGIFYGGLLHDIGKIGIPDEVLNKPAKLTDDEYELIKKHPVIGWEGLVGVEFPWPEVMPIVRHHHEKWNGKGYPDGLARDHIPLEAQIIGVADFYDALTTNRPYRGAYNPHKALTIMKQESGTFFNDILIEAFELILDDIILTLPSEPAPVDHGGRYILPERDPVLDNVLDELQLSWGYSPAAAG
ncbi:MAG: tetratricopeptide repeat protein [Armatimonadetes bacterium]|nr:tetratricopeptide repeat protein [Armatimonadota bacterium]